MLRREKELEAMGADTICIKDMAGLIAPYDAYAIVKALKKTVKPRSIFTATPHRGWPRWRN
jgi:oxaloacetate decarboxylase alpha subunit/pyruvate carboxylase subunit B